MHAEVVPPGAPTVDSAGPAARPQRHVVRCYNGYANAGITLLSLEKTMTGLGWQIWLQTDMLTLTNRSSIA